MMFPVDQLMLRRHSHLLAREVVLDTRPLSQLVRRREQTWAFTFRYISSSPLNSNSFLPEVSLSFYADAPQTFRIQMETFAQVSDGDPSDRSFVQYDAAGKVVTPGVFDPENQAISDEFKKPGVEDYFAPG